MRITYFLAFIVLILVWSCEAKKDKSAEAQSDADLTEESTDTEKMASQSWIDDSEMDVLSNTWVAEDDKGELSSTWTEDAYAEELNASPGLANSWVDESGETVYAKAELPPEFVGGKEALFNHIKETIQYPDDVEAGNIYVAFIIGSDGAVRDARVFKGVKESMDKEALRIINNMPNWDPGLIDGKPVASVYGLPIIFKP
jgi:outer membrane biosynthesis protein TonB